MQVKLFTIPLFGSEEAVEEMNKFLRGNKVVDITKNPFFCICHAEAVNISICNAKQTTLCGCRGTTALQSNGGVVGLSQGC